MILDQFGRPIQSSRESEFIDNLNRGLLRASLPALREQLVMGRRLLREFQVDDLYANAGVVRPRTGTTITVSGPARRYADHVHEAPKEP